MFNTKFKAKAQLESLREQLEKAGHSGGANGLYTPDMIESLESSDVARTLNALVARINLDADSEARSRARFLAFRIFIIGLLLGAGLMYVAIMLWAHPFAELAKQLSQVQGVK